MHVHRTEKNVKLYVMHARRNLGTPANPLKIAWNDGRRRAYQRSGRRPQSLNAAQVIKEGWTLKLHIVMSSQVLSMPALHHDPENMFRHACFDSCRKIAPPSTHARKGGSVHPDVHWKDIGPCSWRVNRQKIWAQIRKI